jgi:hypothetical protein
VEERALRTTDKHLTGSSTAAEVTVSSVGLSTLEYQISSQLSFLRRGLLTPPVVSEHCTLILQCTNDMVNTREKTGEL